MGTTIFVWDPVFDCVTHELDENNAVKAEYHNEPQQYGGVLSQRRGTTSHYHHQDALGSTRFLTDSSGNVTDTYLNDAWGNSVASTGTTINPFKWVGKYGYYTDNSTAQVYVRARMYQPTVARCTSLGLALYGSFLMSYSGDSSDDGPVDEQPDAGQLNISFAHRREGDKECCSTSIFVNYLPTLIDRKKYRRIDLRAIVRTHIINTGPELGGRFGCGEHWNGREPHAFGPDDWNNSNGGYTPWTGGLYSRASYDDFPGINAWDNPTFLNGPCPGVCRFESISQDFEICVIAETAKGIRENLGCRSYGWMCKVKYGQGTNPDFFCTRNCKITCKTTFFGGGIAPLQPASSNVTGNILVGPWPEKLKGKL